MTLEEKVDMLHGEQNDNYGFYNAPIERLGIPALAMADGTAGVRISNVNVNGGRSTQLPAPLALAATWDHALAEEYGRLAGDEAFRTGHNVLLAPAVDIARIPQAGRAFETFGEDPLLSGTMGAAELRGIQENPIITSLKHYNLYTQEQNRLIGGNAVIDERALQEIYTRPFDIGIRDGHPSSVMCGFNKVNGVYACESDFLLNEILKTQLEFQGWVMSDYGATHSTDQAIISGMDQEMPGNFSPQNVPGDCFFCGPLLDAVNAGRVPISRIDDAVLRILRPMFALGLFDNAPVVQPLPEQENGAFARQVSEQASVLLKNDDILPLDDSVGSVAVIGADADVAAVGGGSARVTPTYEVGPLQGIQTRVPGATVTHQPGTDPLTSTALLRGPDPIPSDFLTPANGEDAQGVRVEYFDNLEFSGTPAIDRTEPYVGQNGGFFFFQNISNASPHFPQQGNFATSSIRNSGTLTAPVSGSYELAVVTNGTANLYLDDELLLTTTPSTEGETFTATVQLEAGSTHPFRLDYVNTSPGGTDAGAILKLGWTPPEGVVRPSFVAAADAARDAEVAVVVARDYSTEGGDRPELDLPFDQAELIRQVAAANPRTIVVLTAGGVVQTSDWQDAVPAVLHNWMGGQEQGSAIAGLLFGDVNPSGRLPVSIPVDEERSVTADPAQYPGTGLDQSFSEGIYVGYRGFEEFGIEPQYPFGYGLSYTSYDYSGIQTEVTQNAEAAADDSDQSQYRVKATVKNTGDVAGIETVQVYAGELPTTEVETAPKSLAGWERVDLQPGEAKEVTVTLDPQSFSYWDVDSDKWVTPTGAVPIYVGASSADVRLTGELTVEAQPEAPQATAPPTITGDVAVGKRVEASSGEWNQEGLTFSYQWLRNGEPIPEATNSTYRVASADQGTQLSVQVTAQVGSGPAGVAASEATFVRSNATVRVTPNKFLGTTTTEFSVTVRVSPRADGIVAEGEVTVNVNGSSYSATLVNGRAVVPIGTQDRGIHPINVSYPGSDQVAPSTGWSLIYVRR